MRNSQEIAKIIKNLCDRDGLSVNKLLSVCRINSSFINDLEKKGVMPSVDKIAKIADYFDVTIDYLVGRSEK